MNRVRGYIFSRPFMGERVPQHVQNLVIRDFCNRNHLNYLLSATEYAMEESHLILSQALSELQEVDGIVAYSMFQLPEARGSREYVYEKVLDMKKTLYFAVEGLQMGTHQERDRIETIWRIRQIMPQCHKI